MKFFLSVIFCFLTIFSYGKNFKLNPHFSTNSKNPQAKNILLDYEKFINKIQNKSFNDKLNFVNSYLNSLNARYDDKKNVLDYWSTRGEFLSRGGGDCEDYTIAKYYTLKDLGFNPKNMCLLVVKEKYTGFYHMVLSIWQKDKSQPLILDNLSFKVLPLDKRIDLNSHTCINENGYFSVNKQGKRIKKPIRFKAYEDMLKRQKKEYIWAR